MYEEMEQIEKKYDGKWVFMVNCAQKKSGAILGGEVVLSGKTQAEIYRMLMDTKKGDGLTFVGYVGKAPEGIAYL